MHNYSQFTYRSMFGKIQSVHKNPGSNRKGAAMRDTETLLEIKKPKERLTTQPGSPKDHGTHHPPSIEKLSLPNSVKSQERQRRLRTGQMKWSMHQPKAFDQWLGPAYS